MFTLTSIPKAALDFATGVIPSPVAQAAAAASHLAQTTLSYLTTSPSTGSDLPSYRPSKSLPAFTKFKADLALAYCETTVMVDALRAKPQLSQTCPIDLYLAHIATHNSGSRTHQIYDNLKAKWGYKAFHRLGQVNLKGIATSFITYVLNEDSDQPRSPLHDCLVSFYRKLVPSRDSNYSYITALADGHPPIFATLFTPTSPFLEVLTTILIENFHDTKRALDPTYQQLSYDVFVHSLGHDQTALITQTQADLDRYKTEKRLDKPLPTAPITTLFGTKDSLFGAYYPQTWSLLLPQFETILEKVKQDLIALDPTKTTWLQPVEPDRLLTTLHTDPRGEPLRAQSQKALKNALETQLLDASFTRNLPVKITNKQAEYFEQLSTLLATINPHLLECLRSCPVENLIAYAASLESYQDALAKQHYDFLHFLSQNFEVSFIIHSLENSKQSTLRRLKINHISRWHQPTCHLVFFPEKEALRIDLLKASGLYTQRSELERLISLKNFRLLRSIKSENLTKTTLNLQSGTLILDEEDQQLAKRLIYLRQHVMTCLRLLDDKIRALSQETFDLYGNLEDDPTLHNPWHVVQQRRFGTPLEALQHRLETHITRLNQEISELFWVCDCVYSKKVHHGLKEEIHQILVKAKATLDRFYSSRLPQLIKGLEQTAITYHQEALSECQKLVIKQPEYARSQPTLIDQFTDLFSQTTPSTLTQLLQQLLVHISTLSLSYSDLSRQLDGAIEELRSLVPRLNLEYHPPEVFRRIKQLKTNLVTLDKIRHLDEALLMEDSVKLYQKLQSQLPIVSSFLHSPSHQTPKTLFEALFTPPTCEHLGSDRINSLTQLIDQITPPIEEMKPSNSLLKELSIVISKLESKRGYVAQQEQAEQLRYDILRLQEAFAAINPTKAALLTSALGSSIIEQTCFRTMIEHLEELEKLPDVEPPKILQQLEEFIDAIFCYQGARGQNEHLDRLKAQLQHNIEAFNVFNPTKAADFARLLGQLYIINIPKIDLEPLTLEFQALKREQTPQSAPLFQLLEESIIANQGFKGHKDQRDKIGLLKDRLEQSKSAFLALHSHQQPLFDRILDLQTAFDQPAHLIKELKTCLIIHEQEGPYLHVYKRIEQLITTLKRLKATLKELDGMRKQTLSGGRQQPLNLRPYLDPDSDARSVGSRGSAGGASFASDLGSMTDWGYGVL